IERALEFAWQPESWDADQDGVMEGQQHNTYDIEFYGPNTMCGLFYLGALWAAEEMAIRVGST
ncbi:MAG TPA: GH116 family glycosyl hydrolase, partial [Chthonomonadaceae bacterium]|nr:GH116 family glycosyl hydrolase [Chthonomonadaceae bacterium]